jgi:hypothetical protein
VLYGSLLSDRADPLENRIIQFPTSVDTDDDLPGAGRLKALVKTNVLERR